MHSSVAVLLHIDKSSTGRVRWLGQSISAFLCLFIDKAPDLVIDTSKKRLFKHTNEIIDLFLGVTTQKRKYDLQKVAVNLEFLARKIKPNKFRTMESKGSKSAKFTFSLNSQNDFSLPSCHFVRISWILFSVIRVASVHFEVLEGLKWRLGRTCPHSLAC